MNQELLFKIQKVINNYIGYMEHNLYVHEKNIDKVEIVQIEEELEKAIKLSEELEKLNLAI